MLYREGGNATAHAIARREGRLLHHNIKITDLKPFIGALWSELLDGHTWWASVSQSVRQSL